MGGAHFAFTHRLSTAWFSQQAFVPSETPSSRGFRSCRALKVPGSCGWNGRVSASPVPKRKFTVGLLAPGGGLPTDILLPPGQG